MRYRLQLIRPVLTLAAIFCVLPVALSQETASQETGVSGTETVGQDQYVASYLRSLQEDAALHDLTFVGTKIGYAVGDHGTIRKTEDGGTTWYFLDSPIDSNWQSLCFLTDRIGWIAGGQVGLNGLTTRGVILHTKDGGQSWETITPQDVGMIYHVQFFGFQQGVVCGESTTTGISGIWQTSDGGKSWHVVESSHRNNWRCADFASPTSGVVAGSRGQVGMLGGTRLINDTSLNFGLKGVHDLTIDQGARGWLVGDGGLVRYSPGGASWQEPAGDLPADLSTLFDFRAVATHENSVWIAGHPGSAIWYSHDNGKSWNHSPTGITIPINAIHFSDSRNGWAACEFGIILKTADGGQSWQNSMNQSRRLALLQFTTGMNSASYCLTARYGGHHGYRVGIINYCREDQSGEDRAVVSDDLRQYQAVVQTGGSVSAIDWALPLDIPGLSDNRNLLIKRWNAATDGQLSEIVLSHLVRDLRCYRPSVVVVDQPEPENQAQLLFHKAVQNAVRSAGDPTWMIAQKQYAFLSPWQVPRLFERSRNGQGGDIVLDTNQYMPALNQSVRMAAGPAYQMVQGSINNLPFSESFSISQTTPLPGQLLLSDLFTGIVLGPGSDARRRFLIMSHPDQQRGESIARKQRNYAALTRQRFSDELQASQMIAQLDDVISGSPPRQAVLQLLEIADQYRKNSKWDYYETVLMQILQSFPQEPLSSTASVQLIQLWSSRELNLRRLSNLRTGSVKQAVDINRTRDNFNQILQASREDPEAIPETVNPAIESADLNLPLSQGSAQEKTARNRTWQDRAIATFEHLRKTSPEVAASPDVLLPMAAIFRERAAMRAADDIYRPFISEKGTSSLQQIAAREFYLRSGTGIPPGEYLACKQAHEPPYLDGLLSDECWQNAEEIRLQKGSRLVTDSLAAIVLLTYDTEYLYIAASCPRHPDLPDDLPTRGARKYDASIDHFDRLQICLDINRDYCSSYRLEVDQRGLTRDSCAGDFSWNPKWYVACEGDQSHWRVELAIPLQELLGETPLEPGDAFAISLSRILPAIGVQSWGNQKTEQPTRSSMGIVQFK